MSEPTKEEMLKFLERMKEMTEDEWTLKSEDLNYEAIHKFIEQGKPRVDEKFIEKWSERLIFLPLGADEHWTEAMPRQVKQMLAEAGVEVRDE